MKARKAQLEMVGLIVIVMIAGLAMAFALIYANNQVGTDRQHETFGESVISSNMINSMLQVTVRECLPTKVEYSTLAKDCIASGGGITDGQITCGGESSCYWVNETMHEILDDTLNVWGISYRFTIGKLGEDPAFEKTNRNCGPDDEKEKPGVSIIPLYPVEGEAEVVLEVCKT